jgi:hypothetical protein
LLTRSTESIELALLFHRRLGSAVLVVVVLLKLRELGELGSAIRAAVDHE